MFGLGNLKCMNSMSSKSKWLELLCHIAVLVLNYDIYKTLVLPPRQRNDHYFIFTKSFTFDLWKLLVGHDYFNSTKRSFQKHNLKLTEILLSEYEWMEF